ncbi:MAG: AmmeMemoRadiSam system protein A [Gammaproteobacteria bacterium]
MCSTEPSPSLSDADRQTLLELAVASIRHGLEHGQPLTPETSLYPPSLTVPRATFVTLHKDGDLRGCIGALEPVRALVQDVAHNAYAAAFEDPRFRPVRAEELDRIAVEISILSPAVPMRAESEDDLIGQLRPGVDGLIVAEGPRRGTFLPSVWESLARPEDFLRHLKHKAGLPTDYWSDTLKVWRYTTESFGSDAPVNSSAGR